MDWIDDAPAIRNALTTGHHEYGDLNAPFVIAVGTYIHDKDRWHTPNAMYGAAAVELSEGPDGEMATREIRQPDGYLVGATQLAASQGVRRVALASCCDVG